MGELDIAETYAKCGLCETNKRTAALMLQEREYFAKQIRDIREAFRTLNGFELVRAIELVLQRENPLP